MAFKNDVIRAFTARAGFRGGFDAAETLTATKVLTKLDGHFQSFDPGGSARDVTLPAVTRDDEGYFFLIANTADAAEDLTVKNAAGSTVSTIGQNSVGMVYVNASAAWTEAFTVDMAWSSLPTGGLVSTVISGGSAGDHTVTGIATTDELVSVLYLAGAGTDVTDMAELVAEFTVSAADTVNNTGGTDTTGGKLRVLYIDRS